MGTVTQFPGKPKPKGPHKQYSPPNKEVVISLDTYVDFNKAWVILKRLATETNTYNYENILAVARQLPATPGHRK